MIEFIKWKKPSVIMDPRENFSRKTVDAELRYDPLTGESSRLSHFGMIRPQKEDLSAQDTPEASQRCPFCPANIDAMTPKFAPEILPEGYIQKGETRVIANIAPYDQYNAVVVMSHKHLLTLDLITRNILKDAFEAGLEFAQFVSEKEQLDYQLFGWNYMPPSGGGLVHPHQQVFLTEDPGNLYRRAYLGSQEFFRRNKHSYWEELCTVEEKKGERFIGRKGASHWLVSFAPLGVLGEYLAILPGVHTVRELADKPLHDFIEGLLCLFRYFEEKNISSFNLALFFAPLRQNERHFSLHARIIPRTVLNLQLKPPDTNVLQVAYQEPFSVYYPEELCEEVKPFFEK